MISHPRRQAGRQPMTHAALSPRLASPSNRRASRWNVFCERRTNATLPASWPREVAAMIPSRQSFARHRLKSLVPIEFPWSAGAAEGDGGARATPTCRTCRAASSLTHAPPLPSASAKPSPSSSSVRRPSTRYGLCDEHDGRRDKAIGWRRSESSVLSRAAMGAHGHKLNTNTTLVALNQKPNTMDRVGAALHLLFAGRLVDYSCRSLMLPMMPRSWRAT